jgi:hypothetical protein
MQSSMLYSLRRGWNAPGVISLGADALSVWKHEIKQRWIAATRRFQVCYGEVDPREMDDLTSELDLRKVEPPREAVRDETERVAQRIKRDDDPETHARVRAHIRRPNQA